MTEVDEERRADAPGPQERPRPKRFTFFGSYDHSIDAKGRIIVPNAYRKALGESFTITVSLDDRGIALYPDEAFEGMVDELYALNRRKPAVQKQLDHVARFSYPGMQADNQGRVLLPVKLRQYVLGDARDVEISGALDHVMFGGNLDRITATEYAILRDPLCCVVSDHLPQLIYVDWT